MGQEAEIKNPLTGDPAAIKEGSSLFRANCSPCHGLNAGGGGRGPDLRAGLWVHGGSDSAIFRTISQGVPGTEMPANSFEDSEIWTLVAYLRSVSAGTKTPVAGDIAQGERLFFGKAACVHCHMVKGRGGLLGPDLTRVGAARSVAYLTESIRDPDKDLSLAMSDPNNHYGIPAEYDTVTAVTRDGRRIVGVAKNEDAFSLQLLGQDEKLHLFLKKDLREVIHERRSLMPAYAESRLSNQDLQNLLAYLSSLRGE
ncbi:MAG TPA: c-type cytochrome [Bryobacteraceae bacterium]|nr:c-type cytochrome [Bryobacteraceae bacterium]